MDENRVPLNPINPANMDENEILDAISRMMEDINIPALAKSTAFVNETHQRSEAVAILSSLLNFRTLQKHTREMEAHRVQLAQLDKSIKAFNKDSTRLTKWMLGLVIGQVIVAVASVIVTILISDNYFCR